MRGKKILSRLWWGGLVILAVLWAQVPVMAQEEVTDELAGVKAALAGQMFVVEQLKTNFDSLFGIASDLEGEVNSLKENVESLTEEFLKVTDELQTQIDFLTVTNADLQTQIDFLTVTNADLQTQIDSLAAENAEFQAQISSLKTQRLILGLGLLVTTYLYVAVR